MGASWSPSRPRQGGGGPAWWASGRPHHHTQCPYSLQCRPPFLELSPQWDRKQMSGSGVRPPRLTGEVGRAWVLHQAGMGQAPTLRGHRPSLGRRAGYRQVMAPRWPRAVLGGQDPGTCQQDPALFSQGPPHPHPQSTNMHGKGESPQGSSCPCVLEWVAA